MKYLNEVLEDTRLKYLQIDAGSSEWEQSDYFYSFQEAIKEVIPSARFRELPGRELKLCNIRQYVVVTTVNGYIEISTVHVFKVFKSEFDYNHSSSMIAFDDNEYISVFNFLEYGR